MQHYNQWLDQEISSKILLLLERASANQNEMKTKRFGRANKRKVLGFLINLGQNICFACAVHLAFDIFMPLCPQIPHCVDWKTLFLLMQTNWWSNASIHSFLLLEHCNIVAVFLHFGAGSWRYNESLAIGRDKDWSHGHASQIVMSFLDKMVYSCVRPKTKSNIVRNLSFTNVTFVPNQCFELRKASLAIPCLVISLDCWYMEW